MSFFGLNFGQNADVDILLDNQDERKMADIKDENGRKERLFLFYDGESVTGKVNVTLHRKTNRLEHHGIRIEFIGQIELYYDRGNHHEFLSLVKQLAGPGELTQNTSFEFEFNQVEKPYECYTGANVRLRYFLRVTVVRRLTDMTKELDLLVHTLATYPEMNNPIKMEVGIEECLHIEFEYNKSKYHLKDVIVGKIYFLLVRIKIKHMEVAIIKRETTGSGPNTFHDNETIAKYEIMDGAPVKGESIPIRVFLAGYDLTPTMRDINKKFSVKYYLNLVLVDEEERRYFKQQEITLWRKGDRVRKPMSSQYPIPHQIPHALARHNPGERPTMNVRTAPTPSEPNTPVYPQQVGFQQGDGQNGVQQQNNQSDNQQSNTEEKVTSVAEKVEEMQPETIASTDAEAAVAAAQPVVEPVEEPVKEPIAESVPEPIAESVPEPIAESVPEPIAESVPEPIAESIPEKKPESVPEPIPESVPIVEKSVPVPTEPTSSVIPDTNSASADPDTSPQRLMESPPPMDDLNLEDDEDEEEDNRLEVDITEEGDNLDLPSPNQEQVGVKEKKKVKNKKEPVPS